MVPPVLNHGHRSNWAPWMWGNGISEGGSFPRNFARGTHPSVALKDNRLSAGTIIPAYADKSEGSYRGL